MMVGLVIDHFHVLLKVCTQTPLDLDFLRPTFLNKPKADDDVDIFDIDNDWGEEWYDRNFPQLSRSQLEEYVVAFFATL